MRSSIIIFLAVLFCNSVFSQIAETTQFINGGSGNDQAMKVIGTGDKGTLVAGITNSYGSGGHDILLIKKDSLKKISWTKTYGGNLDEAASTLLGGPAFIMDIIEAENNNYLICSQTLSYGAGQADVYLIKIDNNGNKIWGKTIGGIKADAGYSVKLVPGGGYAISGYTENSGAGGKDALLIKTDTSGSVLWSKYYGGSLEEAALNITVSNKDSGFILVGHTYTFGSGIMDMLIIKTDKNGNLLWSKVIGGTRMDLAFGVAEDAAGNFYVSGQTESFVTGVFGSDLEMMLVKISGNGNILWTKTYGNSAREGGRNIIFYNGNLYFGGWGWSYGAYTPTYASLYLLKIDTSGTVKNTWTFARQSNQSVSVNNEISFYNNKLYLSAGTNYSNSTTFDFHVVYTDTEGTSGDCAVGSHSIGSKTLKLSSATHSLSTGSVSFTGGMGYASTNVTNITNVTLCQPFTAAFGSQGNNCQGSTRQFTDSTTTAATAWLWNFGDNSTSTIKNPSHIFNQPGTFIVKLIAFKGSVKDSTTRSIEVFAKPDIDFTFNNSCFSDSVYFNNKTTIIKDTASYLWNFGDNTYSTDFSPAKLYSSPGNYNVTLTATSSKGCVSTMNKMVTIYPKPIAQFRALAGCDGKDIAFSNTSTVSSGTLTYSWHFPDNTFSNNKNPVKAFSGAGTYDVKLVATTNNGCKDSLTVPITINPSPIVDFLATNDCAGSVFSFTNATTIIPGNIVSYNWDFGNGKASSDENPTMIYSMAGNYEVKLKVTSDAGCMDSLTKTIQVFELPKADFTDANSGFYCTGKTIAFNNNSTITSGKISNYYWDFGNGKTSLDENPGIFYEAAGSYNIKLKVQSESGCIDSIIKNFQIIESPKAVFSDSGIYCAGNIVSFKSQSTQNNGKIKSYSWDFGDGTKTNSMDMLKVFSSPGTYSVSLKVISESGCSDSMAKNITIGVPPAADFTIHGQLFTDSILTFESNLKDTQNIYAWSFGDATVDTGISVTKSYFNPNTYSVTLMVIGKTKCTASTSKNIVIEKSTSVAKNSKGNTFFKLYPNPAQDRIILVSDKMVINNEIKIIGIDGKAHLQEKYQGSSKEFDLLITGLPKGMYWVLITDANEISRLPFIKL